MLEYGASLLGLAFYESIRAYRCIRASRTFVPKMGLRGSAPFVVYFSVLGVFALVAGFAVFILRIDSAGIAFLCGFSVPTGTRLLTAIQGSGADHVEDMASEEFGPKRPVMAKVVGWLTIYHA